MTSTEHLYQSCGVIQTNENYLRLMTLLNHAELEIYYRIFHDPNFGGFPTDPEKLYKQLQKYEEKVKTMLEQKLISQDEYELVYPKKEETYSQEFTSNVFYVLSKECVDKFPKIGDDVEDDDIKNRVAFFNDLDKLQVINNDKKMQAKVNSSNDECDKKWNEIIEALKFLSYDISKVVDLKTGDLDSSKKFRFALIRSEISLLFNECNELRKTLDVNKFAVTKLLRNFSDAVLQSHEDTTSTQSGNTDDELKHLRDRIQETSEKLVGVVNSIRTLKPQIKFWRERNVEGDIIVIDDRTTKLKNEISEQSVTVGELFSSVSLDIVKIKERMSFNGDNIKYIGTPDRRSRSQSYLH